MNYVVFVQAQDIEEILGRDSWGFITVKPTDKAYKEAYKKYDDELTLSDYLVFQASKTEAAKWLGLTEKDVVEKDVEEKVEKN